MAIAALEMLAQGTLAREDARHHRHEQRRTRRGHPGRRRTQSCAPAVGDKYVIDEMLRDGFNFGGEQSGHLIFRDHATTGDGLVAALQMLRIMKAQNALLSQLRLCWTRFPQKLVNIRVREKAPVRGGWTVSPGCSPRRRPR